MPASEVYNIACTTDILLIFILIYLPMLISTMDED